MKPTTTSAALCHAEYNAAVTFKTVTSTWRACAALCPIAFVALSLSLPLLSGCGARMNFDSAARPLGNAEVILEGSIYGGQQPIGGATVQLYAAGSGGDQSAATPLLATPAISDANGNFSLTGLYTCPSSTAEVYLAAQGGNPGMHAGTNNQSALLLSGLGPCGDLTSSTFMLINEVSTVGTVYSLAPFMSSYLNVGSGSSDANALAAAFLHVDELVNTATGTSPGPALPDNFTAPVTSLNALSNVIAACVNSAGGVAGDGSICGQLFSYAAPGGGGDPPTNTADAVLDIANNPSQNVTSLFYLSPPVSVFQPTMTAPPAEWSMAILPDITLTPLSSLVAISGTGTGTISLAQAAPAGGLIVWLTSSNTGAVTVTSPVVIAAGQSSASFSYSGVAAGSSTITATGSGYVAGSTGVTATIFGITLGSLSPMVAGTSASVALSVSTYAPPRGLLVTLTSSNSAVATVQPSSILIQGGTTVPSVLPVITGVGPGTATIYATANGYAPGATSVDVSAASLPLPQSSNLMAEYLLNEGAGTVANDSSGNGNDGTLFGTATWEGITDLNIPNYVGGLSLPAAINTAKTLLFAVYAPPFMNDTNSSNPSWQPPAYPWQTGYATVFFCSTSGAPCWIDNAYGYGAIDKSLGPYDLYSGVGPSVAQASGWHTIEVDCGEYGYDQPVIYYDGTPVAGYAMPWRGNPMCGISNSNGNLQIGVGLSGAWLGKIAFFAAWSTHLSAGDVASAHQAVWSYIQSKGGAPAYLPINRATPAVLAGIDSRTVGYGTSNGPWTGHISLTDSTYSVLNLATAGTTLFDHCAMFNTIYAPYVSPISQNILVFWGGINDINLSSESTAQQASYLQCLVTQGKQLGARVIVATEIDSNVNGDSGKDALDPLIRAGWQTWGADNLVDLATQPLLGADGAYTDGYFADGLHPNDAGEVFITAMMQDGINELLGSTATSHNTTAAAAYQELAGDDYLDLTGTAPQAVTLPSCLGYSLPRNIWNLGYGAASLSTLNNELLTGNTGIPVNAQAILVPVPGPLSTGGCSWNRTQ